ncbi:MAG TPA: hypothetical protein VGO11_23360 [Chthoniobacteraceae bacterium]|nr:hypothetical protein [Chthoniobacteraceae bacterium]
MVFHRFACRLRQADQSPVTREISLHRDLTDIAGYRAEFLRLFGFGLPGVDYEKESEPVQPLPSSQG